MTLFVRSRCVAAVAVLMATLSHPQDAGALATRRGFDLFTAGHNLMLRGNRAQCNINDVGEACLDGNNSPSIGGGFWPIGTSDQYIFNGGLDFVAIIPGADLPNFPWPGDTIGAFFFDPRGDQAHGSGLTPIFDGLNGRDLFTWPRAGRALDPSLFAPALLGRNTVSNQDAWARFWDGNTALTNGRQHPAGMLVDLRTMSYDVPGLEDVIFFVYRLVNISARDPAAYQQLAAAGYGPDEIAEIAAYGAAFQDRMESRYRIQIPDAGYPMDSMYVAFMQDPDIGSAGSNYANMNLVFSTSIAYKSDFRENTWQYPAGIFGPPFAQAPGFAGSAFLRTPPSAVTNTSKVWLAGNTTGGAPFPDAVGVQRLWRNLSGSLLPTDGTCSVASPKLRHFCYWTQTPTDTRFWMSSGPTQLLPGQSTVLVMAQLFAPAIQAVIAPFIGVTPGMVPGFPVEGSRLLNGLDTLRNLDRAAGWISHANVNGNGAIEANEVLTTPGSLFWKVQTAQAALDRGFLMPSAPEAPDFYAVAGDNRATVVWRPSATEVAGDPYFQVAANPASPQYDPDYRQYDVEGYRIWRGRTPASMQVIAQFDYAGTLVQDYSGQFLDASYGNSCAPEVGVTTSCPALPHVVSLSGTIVQTRLGDRVVLQNGAVVVLHADTAVTGGGSGRLPLRDTAVPLIYVDSTVRSGETYVYGVTAFDVNSYRSGASTMESPLAVKTVTPRVPASNNQPAVVTVGLYGSDGVTELDPGAPFPAINPATGTFNGMIPPANGATMDFLASVAEALPLGDYIGRIDSVTAGMPQSLGVAPQIYMTFSAPGVVLPRSFPMPLPSHGDVPFNTPLPIRFTLPLVPFDTAAAARAGIPLNFSSAARMLVDFTATYAPISSGPAATMLCGRGLISVANCGGSATIQASRYLLHSRWFDEFSLEPSDPTIDFNPSPDRNSGKLTGVSAIWNPLPYRVPLGAGGTTRVAALFRYYAYAISTFYPADFVVTWGAGGQISMRDSTHRTSLPFTRGFGVGYGFLNGAAIAAAGVTTAQLIAGNELGAPNPAIPSYHALYTVSPVCDMGRTVAGVGAIPCVSLSPTAVLQPLDLSNPADGLADAVGLVMVVNGESFFMQTSALPNAGTKWHLRAIGGLGMTASCTPPLPAGTAELLTPPLDCASYAYTSPNPVRPALAPGLQFKIRVTQVFGTAADSGSLAGIHTVPDPYYFTNSLETANGPQVLRFVNLPDRAIIRIYSAAGALTAILTHHDASGGGEQAWDLRTRGGRAAASGVYFYHVETADGRTKTGRFVVVNGSR